MQECTFIMITKEYIPKPKVFDTNGINGSFGWSSINKQETDNVQQRMKIIEQK